MKHSRTNSEITFQGRVFNIRKDTIQLEDGKTIYRENIDHDPVSVILPIDSPDTFYLVNQYRSPLDDFLLEVPAGMIEPDENPLEGAKRELQEETGFTAAKWTPIGSVYSTPGFTDEILHLFIAEGLTHGQTNPDDDEYIEIKPYTFDQIDDLLRNNKIQDAKTMICLQYAKLHLL